MKKKPPPQLIKREDPLALKAARILFRKLLKIEKRYFFQIILAGFLVFLFMVLCRHHSLERLEKIAQDRFFRMRQLPVHSDIVMIDIAEDSIRAIGRWPWPRHYHGVLTHILTEWKAKAIVFDILFSEESTPFDDGAFKEALKKSCPVFFPVVFEPHTDQEYWIEPLDQFKSYARGLGHINIISDSDGIIRSIQPFLEASGTKYPHLALEVTSFIEQKSLKDISRDLTDNHHLDERGKLPVNWAGRWENTFQHYSYVDLIKSFQAIQSGKTSPLKPELFQNKICIIGLTATGNSDIKPIPVENNYPVVGIHANIMNSFLTHRLLRISTERQSSFYLILLALIAVIFFVPYRPLISFIAASFLCILWPLAAYFLFASRDLIVPVVLPVLLVVTLFFFSMAYSFILINKDRLLFFKMATRDGLTGLYVIRHFRILLNQSLWEAQRTGQNLCLVMIDIDHFKQINDTFGHPAGDMILKSVAFYLSGCIRVRREEKESDLIGRYGGEEFIVFLRGTAITDAVFKVAERMRQAIEKGEFLWEGKKIEVTVSLGVSQYRSGDTSDMMISRADEALYRAKHEGRNRICIENKGA